MCFAWSFRDSIISGIPDSIIRSSFSSSSESAHITDIHSSQIEGTFNFVERILITSLKILCFEEVFNKSKVKINNLKMFLENTFKDFSAVAMAELHSFTHKVQRARKVVVTTESSENSMLSFRKAKTKYNHYKVFQIINTFFGNKPFSNFRSVKIIS